jgi:hypothetical protein
MFIHGQKSAQSFILLQDFFPPYLAAYWLPAGTDFLKRIASLMQISPARLQAAWMIRAGIVLVKVG